MKTKIFIILFLVFFAISADAKPRISFEQLITNAEQNNQLQLTAGKLATKLGQPVSIRTTTGFLIDAKAIEDGKVVYSVIKNAANIYEGSYAAFIEEITPLYNNTNSKIYYGNGMIVDNTGGQLDPVVSRSVTADRFLLIPEWTDDKVYMFDAQTGDLLDANFIPTTAPQLQSPRDVQQHFSGRFILVADQLSDVVQKFDTNGTYIGFYAPSSGVNNAILDNIRGICYRPNGNMLVTVGSGTSQNTIQQFDTGGVSIGGFITSGLNSPFDILIRTTDILVSNSSGTNKITRYDLSGTFLNNYYTTANINFPQQLSLLPGGRIGVCAFSTPNSGFTILDSAGNYIRTMTAVTGLRGSYLLGNGNYLVTNAAGVHEIDSVNGSLIRTVTSASNFQYISPYNPGALLSNGNNGSSLPENYSLEQNYPNPFNPSTGIKFSIPKSNNVTLKVYDLTGRVVASLVNEYKPAGSYEVTFDASALSSGVYYYSISSGEFTETRKMVLVK
ncbi:MAG TPA: T9SS type A sorting domain-containing protein [Ignavibacteria bacterium]|nr:T9SS type A sorting domain-containing protein [Ignavibacteria bacterium]HRF64387.1 T9SS type A sorting domain-containing protein [Ignavibacteria bacterium]HRJ03900.1 T9SS type A sorting domain-containing protein [Ignavibacteria bacterium]HRJ84356.1 T9SS type A sorting domain-containing protein [Ignavibacteria bacterium]